MLRTQSPRKGSIYRLLAHYNSLSNKMDNSLLAVRVINHKYIVAEREYSSLLKRIIDICRNPWSLRQIESELPLEELKENEEIQAIEQIIQIMGLGDIDSLVKAADKRVWLTEEFDGSRLAPLILEMNYTFLISNGEPFITSSFPAIY